MKRIGCWLVLLVGVMGCQPAAPTYYADVQPILEGRCVQCHAEGKIGGFSLQTYEEATQWAEVIGDVVENGTMPPWPASDQQDYKYDWSLTESEIDTIVRWVDKGTREGDADQPGEALPPVGSSLSEVDVTLSMSEAYHPDGSLTDEYRCFVIPWNETETTYVTGFNARPGNNAIVHHIAAYLVSPDGLLGTDVFDALDEWEAESEGYGYPCYGGPAGQGSAIQIPIQQIAQWVPGTQGFDFPAGSGVRVEPTSRIVLQIHYHPDGTLADPTDHTSIDFSTQTTVEREGAFAPWLNALWPMGEMTIPGGATGVSHSALGDPRNFFEMLNPSMSLDGGFDIHTAMLHMHEVGASADVRMRHSDGSEEMLLSIPSWDFDWQLTYHLENPMPFEDGDSLLLTCTFDNDGPDAVDVTWGEGTVDEMCVANLYITGR